WSEAPGTTPVLQLAGLLHSPPAGLVHDGLAAIAGCASARQRTTSTAERIAAGERTRRRQVGRMRAPFRSWLSGAWRPQKIEARPSWVKTLFVLERFPPSADLWTHQRAGGGVYSTSEYRVSP